MVKLTIKPGALPVNMDHSHLDYKKPTLTPQRLTRTDTDMHILDWFILISCNSPYLLVIQAHLAARGHPIRAESDRGHSSIYTSQQRWLYSPLSYLATNFSWRPTGTLKDMNKMLEHKYMNSIKKVMFWSCFTEMWWTVQPWAKKELNNYNCGERDPVTIF